MLGHLSGTATDMSETRLAFERLSSNLLNQLARETLKKTALAMQSKAQVAVDIMIRNLFERTADIGFLAMDDEERDYLEKFAPLNTQDALENSGEALQQADAKLRLRFAEYVQKYSVYSDIILLDVDGTVLLQLDQSSKVSYSTDPLIEQSLNTTHAYVETFRNSDLVPGQGESLIYSYRVSSSDGQKNWGCCVWYFVL